jgi:hypothetical protein
MASHVRTLLLVSHIWNPASYSRVMRACDTGEDVQDYNLHCTRDC